MRKYCWAVQSKSGSFIHSMNVDFNNAVEVALFRTKQNAVAFLKDNPKLFASAKPVKVSVKISVIGDTD